MLQPCPAERDASREIVETCAGRSDGSVLLNCWFDIFAQHFLSNLRFVPSVLRHPWVLYDFNFCGFLNELILGMVVFSVEELLNKVENRTSQESWRL